MSVSCERQRYLKSISCNAGRLPPPLLLLRL
jgi:hypothetical protein